MIGVDNLTIETNGASTEKTILLFNDNDPVASFRGIHLKTDSQGTSLVQNSIFIECDGRAAKGAGDGVDIRSEDGILIRAEDPVTGTANNIQIRATEHIDLHGGTSSITPTTGLITRTKIHGVTEIVQLYRPEGSKIITNLDTISSSFGASAESGHTEFEAINTYHLLRATTKVVKNSTLLFTDSTCDTVNGNNTVNFTSTSNPNAGLISDGMKVTGDGIPTNTFVTNKLTNSFQLRDNSGTLVNATADGTNVTLSFFNNISRLQNGDYILIASLLDDEEDDAVGTMWKISISYYANSTNLAQVWYVAKQNAKFAWIGNNNGETLSGDTKGIATWTTSNGIRWQNATGYTATNIRCSALKIHSGTNDF